MNRNIVALTSLALLVASPAVADPAYKASDIVNHFASSGELGATRGLCIGTEAECKVAPSRAKALAAFDLVVNFDYNSDVLTKSARQNLDEFAKALQDPRLAAGSFVVEGHTDAKGSETYNLTLSERRAAAVVRYLSEKGIDTSKLAPRGFGEAKPKAANPFDPANRRVETRLRVE